DAAVTVSFENCPAHVQWHLAPLRNVGVAIEELGMRDLAFVELGDCFARLPDAAPNPPVRLVRNLCAHPDELPMTRSPTNLFPNRLKIVDQLLGAVLVFMAPLDSDDGKRVFPGAETGDHSA